MIFDPMYLLFVAPGMIFALIATFKVKSTFAHYSQTMAGSGMTGAEALAQRLFGFEQMMVRDLNERKIRHGVYPTSRSPRAPNTDINVS